MGESDIQDGKKLVLFETDLIDQKRYTLLQFNQNGKAAIVGNFNQIHHQMNKEMEMQGIMYAKQYFINPDGEIIKFAAKITPEKAKKVKGKWSMDGFHKPEKER